MHSQKLQVKYFAKDPSALDLEAVGLPQGDGLPVFLRFCTERSAGRRTGPELVQRWCRDLVTGPTESKRIRAARRM